LPAREAEGVVRRHTFLALT